jgi:hypothetical protein
MTTVINSSAARERDNQTGDKDARELQDSELEAVSGGASMVEYAIIRGAVLAIAVAKRLSS